MYVIWCLQCYAKPCVSSPRIAHIVSFFFSPLGEVVIRNYCEFISWIWWRRIVIVSGAHKKTQIGGEDAGRTARINEKKTEVREQAIFLHFVGLELGLDMRMRERERQTCMRTICSNGKCSQSLYVSWPPVNFGAHHHAPPIATIEEMVYWYVCECRSPTDIFTKLQFN